MVYVYNAFDGSHRYQWRLVKLPFPLTVRFKSMLQAGVSTPDMDVSWVSSLSWYFLNLFGLRGIFSLILGEGNTADGMHDMQAMSMGAMGSQPGQPQNFHKLFLAEKENLDIATHQWALDDVEERLLRKYGVKPAVSPTVRASKKTATKQGRKKKLT
ncbi:hypothetical protein H4R34_000540 [Dimargaris verticillata]|uniref:ER membrane protein complex subunit 3 n=1 Tax=Dimargaris verticillata TaxID=2761393 RepID=A0A9W8B7X6_9FUNG|nr:hypothetical protein H4R34_000540 [Dimargaris verticillata]